MTPNTYPQPTKIIQFPVKSRAIVIGSSDEAKSATNLILPRAIRTASGSGWYHDEAIQDAERADKK